MNEAYALPLNIDLGHAICFEQGDVSGHKNSRSLNLAHRVEVALTLQKNIPWGAAVTSAGGRERMGSLDPSLAGLRPEAEPLN